MSRRSPERLALSYVLPLRWSEDQGLDELVSYLAGLAALVEEVIVVDGSPPARFELHARRLRGLCRHLPPDPDLRYAMGKVTGVITGVRVARAERVVIADDDVRYDREVLGRTARLLDDVELVRPQNYFRPLVWHARWDTARTLLNRVFSGDPAAPAADFPGTLAVRRSFFVAAGAYDGDVMFENLELIRTFRAAGGRVASPLDLYVARRPPTTRHFLGQRVRQAYDDLALPLRLGIYLAVLPALIICALRRPRALPALATIPAAIAEAGRRRAGGTRVFPRSGSLLAPAWVLERAVTSWLAVGARARGGIGYGDDRIRRAASSERALRARYRIGSGEPSGALSAVKPTSL
jgi:hypothetical protein